MGINLDARVSHQTSHARKTSTIHLKGGVTRGTCNVDFSRNNVSRKIEHCCEFLTASFFVAESNVARKNRPRHHVTWCSILRSTLLREKSTLQVVPCNTALKEHCHGDFSPIFYKAGLKTWLLLLIHKVHLKH